MIRPAHVVHVVAAATVVAALLILGPTDPAAAQPAPSDDRGAVPDAPQATTTLESKSDAFVSSRNADSNYGTASTMNVGQRVSPVDYGATRSLVWFDVSDLGKSQAVTDSKLRLFLRAAGPISDSSRDVVIYRVRDSWPETGVTWNNFPRFEDSRLGTTSIGVASGGWYEWGGLNDAVRRARVPTWNKNYRQFHGLYIQGYEADGSFRAFDTREGSNKPQLRLEHETDTKAPTSTMDPLPQYTTQASAPSRADIALSWDGEDPSPYTGIDFFRLYARRNSGEWFLSGDELKRYEISYPADDGGVYEFAVYAVDQAGNVERTKDADTRTHVDLSPPISSAKPLPEFVTGPFTVYWEGMDQPTGTDMVPSGIQSYNCYFRVNGGEWLPLIEGSTEAGRIFDSPMVDNAKYEFTVGARDNAGHEEDARAKAPQASTILDRVAPTVVFDPVSGTDNTTFTVSWRGEDFGGSGAVAYDIQYRRNREMWRDWTTNTTRTSEVFTGEYTNIYEFRGRARDRAGNEGAYPTSGQLVVGVVDPADLTNHIMLPFAE